MAYQLRTKIGQTIYRLLNCTVEPLDGSAGLSLVFITQLGDNDRRVVPGLPSFQLETYACA